MYVFIANKGPQKALNIANALNCNKSTVYDNLKRLQEKELVTKERALFSALPFEETLELLIREQREAERLLAENKKNLLKEWNNNH